MVGAAVFRQKSKKPAIHSARFKEMVSQALQSLEQSHMRVDSEGHKLLRQVAEDHCWPKGCVNK